MDARHAFTVQRGFNSGSRIERCIEHCQNLFGRRACICPRFTADLPQGSFESGARRCVCIRHFPVRREPDRAVQCRAVAAFSIINANRTVRRWITAPCPETEIFFKRAGAKIAVEIAVAGPLPPRRVKLDRDVGNRREGSPNMCTIRCQQQFFGRHRLGRDPDLTTDTADDRRGGHLINVDNQLIAVPVQRRRPDGERIFCLFQRGSPAVRHREPSARSVGGDVDADVVFRVFATAPFVPRRKHRSDKGNHRYSAFSVI